MGQTKEVSRPIRLVFELARQDNPRLYDELALFPQGAKRVNRLRVLAYDGLLAQYGVFALGTTRTEQGSAPAPALAHVRVTNAVFEPGDSE